MNPGIDETAEVTMSVYMDKIELGSGVRHSDETAPIIKYVVPRRQLAVS